MAWQDEESAPQPLLGMTMLVFCAISNAVMFLAQKKLLRRYPCTSVTAWYYLAAGLLTAIIASRELFIDPTAFIEPFQSTLVIVALAYAVCFATVVNYEVLSWANGHTAASTVMSFAAIQTVRTTILSSALLHTEAYVGQMANFDANLSQGGASAGALHFHDH